jgi:RHS repeat-associated protein
VDPEADVHVGDFFRRLPDADYVPTWHARRQVGALGPEEQAAADKAAAHADTPTVAHADALGRPFLTVAHNRFEKAGVTVDEKYTTRTVLDIEGNQRAVIDARGRVVMRYDYDMLGTHTRQASMEAGERRSLNDVTGKPVFAWDSRGHVLRTVYDLLRRPTGVFLRDGANPEILVQRTEYGEAEPKPETTNLRGRVVRVRDGAGVVTSDGYDFKGNLLRSSRQLASDYKKTPDWSAAVAMDPNLYASSTTFDALNRPVTLTMPDASVIRSIFNEANLLERVEVNLQGAAAATAFVTNIDYNAKGQRTRIDYGNGARTEYRYDPDTFRLTDLFTTRGPAFPDDGPDGVQNLHYTYDPAGNISHIRDGAQQTVYFQNRLVEPSSDYTYDAIYRLIAATGREHLGQAADRSLLPPTAATHTDAPRTGLQHPGDGDAMGTYSQRYLYDAVGNILEMAHRGTRPVNLGWTRAYHYVEASQIEPGQSSNRLSDTQLEGDPAQPFTYDAHGNMTTMPHLPLMQWDYADRLAATSQQVVNNGGTPEITYYVYDATGQRVRKVAEQQAAPGVVPTRKAERIYLGGFEVYREYGPDGVAVVLERETLQVMDDKQRVAMVETLTQDNGGGIFRRVLRALRGPFRSLPTPVIRYQFGNHLGSAALELDDQGRVISYEEYYPYGSTSCQAVRSRTETPKRYRYTGKERDEETGLYYHGTRYYVPWLGRWTSCDPAGMVDGTNLFVYVRDNPAKFTDPMGSQATASKDRGFFQGVWNRLTAPSEEQKAQQAAFREGRYGDFACALGLETAVGGFVASNPAVSGTVQAYQMVRKLVALPQQLEKAVSPHTKGEEAGAAAADVALTVMDVIMTVAGPKAKGVFRRAPSGATSKSLATSEAAPEPLTKAPTDSAPISVPDPVSVPAEAPAARSVGAAALDDPAFESDTLSHSDTSATVKSIRRHAERLVSGEVVSNDASVRRQTARVQSAILTGKRSLAGQAMHELHFEFSRGLESPELRVDRRMETPGGRSEYRRPDFQLVDPNYFPATPTAAWDLKLSGLNEYSHYSSAQFTDIREATGIRTIPLYYRLPGMRRAIPLGYRLPGWRME